MFGLLGGYSKKIILQGVNQNKYFTGANLEMTYITGGKALLTLESKTLNRTTKVAPWR